MNLPSIHKSTSGGSHLTSKRDDPPTPKLSVVEAARFLGLSVSTLNKMRLNGSGPLYLKLGRRVLYDLRDLDAWALSRARSHTS